MNMDRVTTPLAYITNGSLVVFGVAMSDWALLVGMLCGVFTAYVNWKYKRKERADRLRALGLPREPE